MASTAAFSSPCPARHAVKCVTLSLTHSGGVNLLVGSASAKWALLSPIFVPMLMQLGISPELTQAAYRVGDSASNIVTPLMPYFPLVVVFCKRYVTSTGIGTVVAMMAPYSFVFYVGWIVFLLAFWALGLPLGLQATDTYLRGPASGRRLAVVAEEEQCPLFR
jgi:p-aminobenzoyl-glutamate transporter AbgT